jgi:hypothetical protein
LLTTEDGASNTCSTKHLLLCPQQKYTRATLFEHTGVNVVPLAAGAAAHNPTCRGDNSGSKKGWHGRSCRTKTLQQKASLLQQL